MPQKYLKLEDTRVYYDRDTGSIRLVSMDPRLKGLPFQMNLVRDSNSTRSIHSLLEAEGILGDDSSSLPDLAHWPTSIQGRTKFTETTKGKIAAIGGKNLRFLLGETYDDSLIEIDLHREPHTLIAGIPGIGKSVLLRSLMEQIVGRPGITLCHIDLHHPEEAVPVHGRFRPQDKLATDVEEALILARSVSDELDRRYSLLAEQKLSSWLEDPAMGAIVFALEDLVALFREDRRRAQEIYRTIGNIARTGRGAGIYLIMVSQEADTLELGGELKANLGRRILMGSGDRQLQESVLGSPISYRDGRLDPVGRGIIRIHGSQMRTFQGFAPE